MLGPLFAVFSSRIGGDILDITHAWAAYLIATGVFIVIVGRLSDKVGKEKFLVAGYALNAVFTFCYLFVDTPFKLLFVQAGLGLATAMATPTWDALYEHYGDKKHPAFAWSLDTGVSNVVVGIAIIVGGLVLVNYSFTALFVIMGCVQVAATAYVMPILWRED